jgi:hypothetical protein
MAGSYNQDFWCRCQRVDSSVDDHYLRIVSFNSLRRHMKLFAELLLQVSSGPCASERYNWVPSVGGTVR